MSSTTTTTSPSTRLQIRGVAAAHALPSNETPVLTRTSRQGVRPPTSHPSATIRRADASSEPPIKQVRLDQTPRPSALLDSYRDIEECLRRQVFPHIDAQLATLPNARVDTFSIGHQVVLLPALLLPRYPSFSACHLFLCHLISFPSTS